MSNAPKIISVRAMGPAELQVQFDNGVVKMYDFGPLLSNSHFRLLRTWAFFRAVRVDSGGYGVSWNDDIDLSGDELWTRGIPLSNE